ncbi:MAG: dihydropteroate synthase [Oxalobacteraceae bacterium]
MENYFQCGRYRLPLQESTRPYVMGVLNATPDSFSDGGQYYALESALSRAEQMVAEGVDIIDIGGETTRPGAEMLPLDDELQRVMPLVYALRDCGKPLSIDTYKPQVMRQALAAGADMINDVNGFRAEGAVDAVKDSDCGLCVMHMQNQPKNMQNKPQYTNTVDEVISFLAECVARLQVAGIARSRICIDPGFGFGKTLSHNLALLKNISIIQDALDLPLLAGMSRKSMLGTITGRPVEKRLAGSLAAALAATANGARILRVHDVAETIDALAVWQAATR